MSCDWDNLIEARRHMVDEQIRHRGVRDERVLEVMAEVPREQFVTDADFAAAFEDRALAIACGQSISQPYMVAVMTELLFPQPAHRVLEIGTGSGYQTAVLARLVAEVFTIERIEPLQREARPRLESLGIRNVQYRVGDGTLGWPEAAPFDSILVTAGAPEIPQALIEQLADRGRLVIPVGDCHEQVLTVVEKFGSMTRELPQFHCRFVRLIGAHGWPDACDPDPEGSSTVGLASDDSGERGEASGPSPP